MRVVLVHGSWFGSWCWDRVGTLLRERRMAVEAIDLPSCGARGTALADLDGDIAALRRLLERDDEPVLLCAHSYGGAPATAAAAGNARIRRIVYLTSFMLDVGESCALVRGQGALPSWCVVGADGSFTIDSAAAGEVLFGDCDDATQKWATEQLVSQNVQTAHQTIGMAAWHTVPATYVRCSLDLALPPEVQRRFAARADETLELRSSHCPFLSQPERVADLLAERAR